MPITDEKRTEAWLKEQPHQVQIAFATRCALRALPAIMRTNDAALRGSALPVLRAILTSAVAASCPTPEIIRAADAAAAACSVSTSTSAARCASAGASAARSAGDATSAAGFAIGAARSASLAVAEATDYPIVVGLALTTDDTSALSSGDVDPAAVFLQPLWPGGAPPEGLARQYEKLRSFWKHDAPVWTFWHSWYEDILAGRLVDWDFLRQVVLLPDEDWKAGPERIADRIEELQTRYLAKKTPQAERIEFVPETARFRAVPVPVRNPGLLGASLSQLSDALDDALANPSNGLSERSREARVLRRTVAKYGNDPQRIEMDLTTVHAGLTRQIVSEDLPPSEENLALQAVCEEGARAVRATHPEIAENRRILSRAAWKEMTPEARATVEAALPVLTAISEDDLADQFRKDIPELVNDAIGPVPNWAPKLPGADPATRIFGRVSRMSIILRSSVEALDAVAARLGMTRGEVIGIFVSLVGLGISLIS